MPEKLTAEQRSRNMAQVRNRDTVPEIKVRKLLHALGFRFRVQRRDLPGRPDIVLPRYRSVVFVHGCFWHSHDCPRGRRPQTRTEFWNAKLEKNKLRDAASYSALTEQGWRVVVVWECETRDLTALATKLLQEISDPPHQLH